MKRMRIGWRWTSTAKKNRFCLPPVLVIILSIVRSLTNGQSIDRCDVSSVLVPNANVRGGQSMTTVSNVTECEIVCSEMTSCIGFDWDWSTQSEEKCFLLTSDDDDSIQYNATGVDHYGLIRDTNHCIGSCSNPRWVPVVNTHGFGGEWLAGVSLTDCARHCTLDPSCFSFDWDPFNPDGKNCWIINSFSAETSPATGVYHYGKNCTPISTTVVRSFGSSITTLPTTTLSSSFSTTTTTTTTTSLPRTTPPKSSSSSSSSSSLSSSSSIINSIVTSISTTSNNTSGLGGSTTFTAFSTSGIVPIVTSNSAINSNSTTPIINDGPADAQVQGQLDTDPMAIKPVYVILAGIGGGCLLLVLTAVCVLCQYPLHHEDDGLLKGGFIPYPGDSSASSNELVDMNLFDSNPEFRSSGVIATEFVVASVN